MGTAIDRGQPYIWVSWLASVMSGDWECGYRAWFKANKKAIDIVESDFDLTKWKADHTTMLSKTEAMFAASGIKTLKEFEVKAPLPRKIVDAKGKETIKQGGIILSGKIDLLVVDEANKQFIVIDCKTGKPKGADSAQVLIYCLLLSKHKDFKHLKPRGIVQYKKNNIKLSKIPDNFLTNFNYHVGLLGGPELKQNPGSACKWCDIASVDCPSRVDYKADFSGSAYEW